MIKLDANANGVEVVDEVENYLNSRYISSSQAYWRIYGFHIHGKYPAVEKLPCHPPGEQIVCFNDENVRDTVEHGPPRTKLTAFFDLNRTDEIARHIPYPDIRKYFTWNAKEKKWDRRRKRRLDENGLYSSEQLGRIPIISLNAHQAELYYLRMLLYNTTDATRFRGPSHNRRNASSHLPKNVPPHRTYRR